MIMGMKWDVSGNVLGISGNGNECYGNILGKVFEHGINEGNSIFGGKVSDVFDGYLCEMSFPVGICGNISLLTIKKWEYEWECEGMKLFCGKSDGIFDRSIECMFKVYIEKVRVHLSSIWQQISGYLEIIFKALKGKYIYNLDAKYKYICGLFNDEKSRVYI